MPLFAGATSQLDLAQLGGLVTTGTYAPGAWAESFGPNHRFTATDWARDVQDSANQYPFSVAAVNGGRNESWASAVGFALSPAS